MARAKSLAAPMAWTYRHGKIDFPWFGSRTPVQFDDAPEVPEQFFVVCQWRRRGNRIPEHWVFNLLYQEARIYALHYQPTSLHENKVGRGRPFYGKVINGIHEHTWSEEGDGYAEPINLPEGRPDIMWRMFLKRANIVGGDFFHPDENQPELDL
jgi:hypothetical protein